MKEKLGFRAKGREVVGRNGSFELRESSAAYRSILGPENAAIRPQN
jgi:putative transposase